MTMNDGNKDLELTEGLREYVSTSLYRRALKLPDNLEEEYHLLAQGEYNRNYVFVHPFTGRKLVLRIMDAQGLIAEERSVDSFLCGFQLAWELAYELNHFETNRHPSPVEEAEMDA